MAVVVLSLAVFSVQMMAVASSCPMGSLAMKQHSVSSQKGMISSMEVAGGAGQRLARESELFASSKESTPLPHHLDPSRSRIVSAAPQNISINKAINLQP